jgi:hypothetical protein
MKKAHRRRNNNTPNPTNFSNTRSQQYLAEMTHVYSTSKTRIYEKENQYNQFKSVQMPNPPTSKAKSTMPLQINTMLANLEISKCPPQNKLEKLCSKVLSTNNDSELDISKDGDQVACRKSILDNVDRIDRPTKGKEGEMLGRYSFKPTPNENIKSMELDDENPFEDAKKLEPKPKAQKEKILVFL